MDSIRRSLMGCVPWLLGMARPWPKQMRAFTAQETFTAPAGVRMITLRASDLSGGGGGATFGPLKTASSGPVIRW